MPAHAGCLFEWGRCRTLLRKGKFSEANRQEDSTSDGQQKAEEGDTESHTSFLLLGAARNSWLWRPPHPHPHHARWRATPREPDTERRRFWKELENCLLRIGLMFQAFLSLPPCVQGGGRTPRRRERQTPHTRGWRLRSAGRTARVIWCSFV